MAPFVPFCDGDRPLAAAHALEYFHDRSAGVFHRRHQRKGAYHENLDATCVA